MLVGDFRVRAEETESPFGCFAPGFRFTFAEKRASVLLLDLDGRVRAVVCEVVEGVERRDVSWEVKSRLVLSGMDFCFFLGGGWP